MDPKMESNYLRCDGSHGESTGSDSDYSDSECFSEMESNLEWIQENCDSRGNLFYLQPLRRDSVIGLERPIETDPSVEVDGADLFLPSPKSGYSKFRHWVTGERRVKSTLKELIKPNWLKKSVKGHSSSSRKVIADENEDNQVAGGSVKFPNAPRIGIDNEPTTKDFLFQLVKEGLNESNDEQDKIFTLMYLASPNDNSSNDKDYAVLVYPPIHQHPSGDDRETDGKDHLNNESGFNNWQRIIKLKGMFVSLSQVINDITGQLPIGSIVDVRSKLESLTTKREENVKTFKSDDKTFIVTYAQEFNSALVLCFPEENYKQLEVISMISALSRFLRFLYNSLDAAFKNCDNHSKIIHYLSIFHHLLAQSIAKGSSLCFHFDMIQRLIIEDDLLLGLDEALSEYESMDWFSDCCFGENGEISSSCDLLIIGSALFYKGYLISSHLPGHYLSDVVSFIKFRGIISLIKRQPIKMVIWQEVFPWTGKNDPLVTDFKENDGTRFFLLIVAVEQTLLCTLLEMPFLCGDLKTKPNELIINQTLRFVASTFNRSGLIQELNQHLNAQSYLFTNMWNGESIPNDRLRQSISARELAALGSHSKDDEASSCDEDHWSEHSSIPSNPLSKSMSSPSIPQVQSSMMHPTPPQTTSIAHTLPPPVHHQFPAGATSLSSTSANSLDRNISLPNEQTAETNSCTHSIPSCIDYYSQDLCFPDYLLFYMDMDLNSRTFCGPVVTELGRSILSPNLSRSLRNVAIYLSEKLNKYYPSLTEIGNHFTFKETFLGPANVRFKNRKSIDSELNLWIVGRKETPDREIYLFFRVPSKGRKSNSFLPTESLFNRLLVQNK